MDDLRVLGLGYNIVAYRDPYFAISCKSILDNFFVGNYLTKTKNNGDKEFYVVLMFSLN